MAKPKKLTEEEVLVLYHEALDNATAKDYVDFDSIDTDKLREILRSKYYDPAVTWFSFIHEIIMSAPNQLKGDGNNTRPLSKKEVGDLIGTVHGKFKRIPIDYEILIQIPDYYPFDFTELTDSISVIKLSEDELKGYQDANPEATYYSGMLEVNKIPFNWQHYLKIKDSGLIESAKNMHLDARHDPIRVFRLFVTVHTVFGTIEMRGLLSILARNHQYSARAYDKKVFVSAINNLANDGSDLSHSIFVYKKTDHINDANEFFKLLLAEEIGELEKVRIQITNSLYWLYEHLNTDDLYLEVVYLVSAFDSLFSIKNSTVPNLENIAPVVAEAIAKDFKEREKVSLEIRALYPLRNSIIHGGLEIQNFRRSDNTNRSNISSILQKAKHNYLKYMKTMFDRYTASK